MVVIVAFGLEEHVSQATVMIGPAVHKVKGMQYIHAMMGIEGFRVQGLGLLIM